MAAPRQSTDAELDALQAVCTRLGGFDDRVSLEWVDGYLAALGAGPRVPTLDEALPVMFGDTWSRTFSDPQDEAQARAALAARWRVLLSQLDPESMYDDLDALRLAPLVLVPQDAEAPGAWQVGEDWGRGFIAAVDEAHWGWGEAAARDADDLEEALTAIRALSWDAAALDAFIAEHAPGKTPTRDDLVDDACYAVQDLRLWWIEHAPRTAPRRVDALPGRNDPCPCGSGRKFKKCHGAA